MATTITAPPRKTGRPRVEDGNAPKVAETMRAYIQTGTMKATGQRMGLAANTVKRILTRNPEDFATAKRALAQVALCNSALAADRARQTAGSLKGLPAFIASKIASQQAGELLGDVPALVQINLASLAGHLETAAAIRVEVERRAALKVATLPPPTGTEADTSAPA